MGGDLPGIKKDGLTIIHDALDAEVDVIIVHGLGGSSTGTFRSDDTGFFWPQHLQTWIPQARIALFGYISSTHGGSSNMMGAQQHAESLLFHLQNIRSEKQVRRPIVFIGHSFGGVVIKQAMILSSGSKLDSNILSCTKMVVFLAVPHRGSHLLQKHRAPVALAVGKVINRAVPPKVMSALEPEGDEAYLINAQFMRIKRDISIINFYEQTSQGLIGDVVVTRQSAVFDSETSIQMPVARNHRDMVKFKSADDDFYHTICTTLQKRIRDFMSQTAETDRKNDMRKMRAEILSCLGDPCLPSTTNQLHQLHSNTLRWIWDTNSEFFNWIRTSHGLFAITGKPGSGKSVLMNVMVNGISNHFGSIFTNRAHHFFNSRGNPIEKSMEGFLRSTLLQLLREDEDLFQCVEKEWSLAYERNRSSSLNSFETPQGYQWDLPTLRELLSSILRSAPKGRKFLIVIDALDECDGDTFGTSSLVSLLNYLASVTNQSSIHICFSCRDLPAYNFTHLSGGFNLQERNHPDIVKFINDQWDAIPSMCDFEDEMMQLKASLIARANGIFLWARLVLDGVQKALAAGATITELRGIIDTPNQLYGLFSMLLGRVEPRFLDESRTMLSIILTAKRPLSLRDFRFILALKDHMFESQDALNKSPDVIQNDEIMKRRIMSRCGGLVEVKHSADLPSKGGDELVRGNSVQFIHQSVKDFIADEQQIEKILPHSKTLEAHGHSVLSRACANYLCQSDVQDISRGLLLAGTRGRMTALSSNLSFLEYAEGQWIFHYQKAESMASHDSPVPPNPLLDSSSAFEKWLHLHNRLQPADRLAQDYDAVQLAVEHDLSRFLTKQFSLGLVDISTWNWKFGSYLHCATAKNSSGAVRVLLENGININLRGLKDTTALTEACREGHLETAALLLEAGAELSAIGASSDDPLILAANSGNIELVKKVLEYAEGVYSHPWFRLRAMLSLARGSLELYQTNVVGQQEENRKNDLSKKAEIFRIICQEVRFNMQDEFHIEPIWMWAFSGCPESSLLPLMNLYRQGVSDDRHWMRPILDMACWFGSMDSVRILLESLCTSGRLPNWVHEATSQSYRTLIHWAALNPRDSVLSYLLSQGLSPNPRDKMGETPLHYATRKSRERHIDILLKYGADRTISSITGMRPFHRGVQNPHLSPSTLAKLIESPSDLNVTVSEGVFPIHLACTAGAIVAVQWLLDNGADLQVQDEFHRTILHTAVSSRSRESTDIVKLLLLRGQTVTARDAAGMTALHHVLYSYVPNPEKFDPEIALENAKLLLKSGADVHAQDQEGNTALHLASWKGHKELIRLLLKYGASPTVHDYRGFAPIDFANNDELKDLFEF